VKPYCEDDVRTLTELLVAQVSMAVLKILAMVTWWVGVVMGSQQVMFKAASSVTKALPPSCSVERFQDFLALESTPSTVLSLNPGIRRTEVLSIKPHRRRGFLIPLVFPGMKM
jgi:hypothetical protein